MPCSPELKKCVDELTPEYGEAKAWAICRSQLGEELHPDFLKIRTQFIRQCGGTEGIKRYTEWINKLSLDPSKPYGSSPQEKFQWVQKHVEFNLWKTDVDAKYWKAEAAFPLESMNDHVYTEEELLLAARGLRGRTPNLNHKFMLDPIEIRAAEPEDGLVEIVFRVPNDFKCPICSGNKTFNDLIESNEIVNLSLEAQCAFGMGPNGECKGLNFTGLAFLTKDTLPGIPLTRIMPLETIMVEALQGRDINEMNKMKEKKIVLKVQEATKEDVAPDGGRILYKHEPQTEPDIHMQCPDGMMFNSELGKCVPDEDCPKGQHWDGSKCVPNQPEDDVHSTTAAGTSPTPPDSVNFERKIVSLQVANLKLEDLLKEKEDTITMQKRQNLEWQNRTNEAKAEALMKTGQIEELTRTVAKLEKEKRELEGTVDQKKGALLDVNYQLEQVKTDRDKMLKDRDEIAKKYEDILKVHNADLKDKLEMSTKITAANEDYLKIAKERDEAKESLERAKILAKKTIRIMA